MSSLHFANSLYAGMLRRRELQKQQELMEQQREEQRQALAFEQNLKTQESVNATKDAEFARHMKVAELQAKNAALLGRVPPQGYENPAVSEFAQASYDSGQVLSNKMREERMLQDREREDAFRKTALQEIGAYDRGGYTEATPPARELAPQLADPAQAMPRIDQPLGRRLDPAEIQARARARGAGGQSDEERMHRELIGRDVIKNWGKITESYRKAISSPDNGTGDIALLVAYTHMVEPESIVREGEFDRAVAAGGLPSKVLGWAQKMQGTGMLPPEIRAEVKRDAQRLLMEQRGVADSLIKEYEAQALYQKLDPKQITWGLGMGQSAPTTPTGRPEGNRHPLDQALGE